MIMIGLWVVVRELQAIARRLGAPCRPLPCRSPCNRSSRGPARRRRADSDSASRDRRNRARRRTGHASASAPPPWHEEAQRARRAASRRRTLRPPAEAAPQAAAQPAVLLDLAQGARTRRGARQRTACAGSVVGRSAAQSAGHRRHRTGRAAARDFRRRLAEGGPREACRTAAAARRRTPSTSPNRDAAPAPDRRRPRRARSSRR